METREMRVMRFTLSILALAGCWRPFSWTSLVKHVLYNIYTLLVISVLYSFTFSQFMEIVLNVSNPNDFTNILYTMMAMIVACCKVLSMWMNHESFVVLIRKLNEGTFRPLVPAEREIRRKCDETIRNNAMCYAILIEITCAGNVLVSLLTNFRNRKLTFPEWVPYDYSPYVIYCLTYTYQYVSVITASFVNVACDSFIVGFLLHVCCQISILNYRLKNITSHNTLNYCVRHHYDIIVYARMVNTRFTGIILFQFVTSTFVICSNLYQLTKTTIGMYHIALITYTFCVMAQIFLYCWFGNKLKVTTRLFLIKRSLEMRVLRLTLRIVMFAGCFRPLSWLSRFKRTAYNIYRTLIITFLYTFATLQFMDIVLKVDNPDDFTDNLYMMLNVSVSGYKLFIMWVNYEDIVTIIKSLTEEPLKPLDPGEMEIRCKFDSLIRANTLRYALLIETSWTCTGLTSLLVDFRQGRLTYREWVPYDYYASYALFFVTYAHQFLSTFYCATVNVACDTLICGLLMHVCCQMEILEYRLKKISQQDDLSYCIRHHNSIFQFARAVNEGFARIIEFQFVTSTLIICSNLFQLSKSTMGANNIALVVYTCCMLTEIFIYCWFGNRVKSKSLQLADSVFQLHWLPLNNSVKKSLLIIMKRATVPIEIVTAYILPLNLDSFVAFMNIILNVENSDEFTDALYMMLTVLVAAYKQTFMLLDRGNITMIIDQLTVRPFAPCESHEVTIRRKFDKMIQSNVLRYLILVTMSITSILMTSFFTELTKRNLTYKAWVPFDYSSSNVVFLLVYTHQLIGMSTSGIVNVACESLICGFLLHICCQLEILEYRLTKISRDHDVLGDCVYHHNRIFTYAYEVNNMFAKIIAIQFAVSMLVVCSNLYRIAMAEDYMSIVPLMFYTSAILAQIFIYCWFGNEVKLKSLHVMNSIYEMAWPALSNDNQKALLLVMKRTMVPVEFSSAYIITMNLDSFVAVGII
ncbi:Odorant receptor 46a, isoform A [Harpegnathos saltator]|uniref:Odorant receptor 46a, isoform A n=1 Tax=Harpegnathos saltator TaxID=610380 RepID=E2BKA5_HARSA|nr:Odorant receptor 46a, isoform A [Harpegnathos saltator]